MRLAMRPTAFLLTFAALVPAQAVEIRVLTLNVQTDASDGRLPGIVALIRQTGADIIGIQEWSKDIGPDAAKAVGFHYRKLDGDTALLSRYPIEPTPYPAHGAPVALPDGRKLGLYNEHFSHAPYQPYQLLGIPYGNGRFIKTEEEAIDEARKARGAEVDAILAAIGSARSPVILVGDFNEPSHLDWTAAAAQTRRHPIKVAWPATSAFAHAGLRDAYRVVYPDELAKPGATWTPTTSPDDPKDHHDRIDFILYRGEGLQVRGAQIVGEDSANADIVVSPYPTDHRGVLATFDY